MNVREALIRQSPSLELQRAAADEIARLDALLRLTQQMESDYIVEVSLLKGQVKELKARLEVTDGICR